MFCVLLACVVTLLDVMQSASAQTYKPFGGQPAQTEPSGNLLDDMLRLLCNITGIEALCPTRLTPTPTSTTPTTSNSSTSMVTTSRDRNQGNRAPPVPPLRVTTTTAASEVVPGREAAGPTTMARDFAAPESVTPERRPPATFDSGSAEQSLRLLTPDEVDLSGRALAQAAGISLVAMILLGFPSQLFNNTLEANYGRLRRVLPWIMPDPDADRSLRNQAVALGLSCAVGGAIGSFQKVHEWTVEGAIVVAVALGFGFFVTVLVFEVAGALAGIRMGLARRSFRAYPGALPIVALFVGMSVLGRLQPAYVYGHLAGCRWRKEDLPPPREQALQMVTASVALLVVAVAAWGGREWVTTRLAADLLAGVTIVGLNRLAFGLIPATFLSGHAIASYSRMLWVSVFVPTQMAFALFVLLPIAEDAPEQMLFVSLVLYVLFAGLSIGVWAAFRRTSRHDEAITAIAGALRS